jgi:prolipoprotein diacylglyceryltransferase
LGGFLGGLAGVEIVKKIIKEKKASGDLFVDPIILALIIGRIGCFSMGVYEETYGTATKFPWGMNLGDGFLRHPVCLYEIIFLTGSWVCFRRIQKKLSLEQGALFKLFMIAYLGFRFLLDFIKPHYTFDVGLSTIQLTCIAGLLYYLPYIIQPKKLLASYA